MYNICLHFALSVLLFGVYLNHDLLHILALFAIAFLLLMFNFIFFVDDFNSIFVLLLVYFACTI